MEIWAPSNGEGRIYVFDAQARRLVGAINKPHRGDAHGVVWVHFDVSGQLSVVRDQGKFHSGVSSAAGVTLEY